LKRRATANGIALPRISRHTLAGIGPRHVGELALKSRSERKAVQPLISAAAVVSAASWAWAAPLTTKEGRPIELSRGLKPSDRMSIPFVESPQAHLNRAHASTLNQMDG